MLHKLLGRHFKEFRVPKLANKLFHGGASASESIWLGRGKFLNLEHGSVLGEGLKGLVGLRQVEADSGDCLREPWLFSTIGGTSV